MHGGSFMFIKDLKKDLFTIPNLLSLFRLIMIPVYVVIYLGADSPEDYYLAAAILAVSCITDMIDGKIARHFNMKSTVGLILDPLADKLTQLTLIICLIIHYPVLLFLIALFVIKESFQLIAGLFLVKKGEILKGALITGKICTTVLFVSLIFLVILPAFQGIDESIVNIITAVDCGFMLLAFADYVRLYCTHGNMIEPIKEDKTETENN